MLTKFDLGNELRENLSILEEIVGKLATATGKTPDIIRLELALGTVTYDVSPAILLEIRTKLDQAGFERDVSIT